MKRIHPKQGPFVAVTVVMLASASVSADYPVMSHRLLADPGSLVYNGRVYLYTSNDDDNTNHSYQMKSIVCVSSVDMKNWTDHGEVFRVPQGASWATNSWAPAVIDRNGIFYLYFGNGAAGVGVATSASPTGPFSDALGHPLINSATPGASGTSQWYFDPAVFIDDDGQAYLYFGGNKPSNARVIKLNSDMISVSGSAMAIAAPDFFEGSWMHKRNGVYYYSYVTQPASHIDYMTSTTSPMSGFTYRGVVLPNDGSINNWNNVHGAIFDFGGKSYIAHHNRYISNTIRIGPTNSKRNLALEELNYNPDGTIQQVPWTTDGVTQLVAVNPFVRQEAEMFNRDSVIQTGGIETEPCGEGGMDVTAIANGDWIVVRGVDFGVGASGFSARVASAAAGGNIELRLDSTAGAIIGACTVTGTGGWQTWTTATCAVVGAAGMHDLYLRFTGGSGSLFNVNWWLFN
ncbi:MAG TPA: glycoside hydrolase family 43 protein [Vicinamibacterales bacterium]|nr:glycoside hydrolase family 43 protein [Vicinamibacterales bacterium]